VSHPDASEIIKAQRAAPKRPPTPEQGNPRKTNEWLQSVYVDFGGTNYRYDVTPEPKRGNDVVSITPTDESFVIECFDGERILLNWANAQIVKTRTNKAD